MPQDDPTPPPPDRVADVVPTKNNVSARGGWRPSLATAGAVLLIFALLQIWRPYFFLTDDNMSAVFPAFVDLGQTLLNGKVPTTLEGLYGGVYDLWRDPFILTLFFPTHFAGLFLAATSCKMATIDAISLIHLLVGALAMQACVRGFCTRFERPLPEWMPGFLGVSYVTSIYSLAIGSSWYNFLGNQAAIPIVALGLVAPRKKIGLACVALGMLYNLLGGHLAPFLFSSLFLGIFAACLGLMERKWTPLWCYGCGTLAAFVVVSPLLIRIVAGFLESGRNAPFTAVAIMNNLSVPALFFGAIAGVNSIGPFEFTSALGYLAEVALPLSFSAAALCFLAVLGTALKFRAPEWVMVAMLALVALFVQRPMWLQALISYVPFFRSLRWPMRETVVFLFFAHLLVALGWWRLPRILRSIVPPLSATAFAVPLLLLPSPTFNRFPVDRALLLDGRAEQIWNHVRSLLPMPSDYLVVPLLNRDLYRGRARAFINAAPHTLLGAYNYPVLFGMKSSTGYTMPGYEHEFRGNSPALWPGYFLPEQFSPAEIADPHLLFTWLQSVDPLAIEYRINGGRVRASFPNGVENSAVVEVLP